MKEFNNEPLMVRELACECGAKWNFENKTLNFTPSLKRVPLTDEQLLKILNHFMENPSEYRYSDKMFCFAKAIEKAHGIE